MDRRLDMHVYSGACNMYSVAESICMTARENCL